MPCGRLEARAHVAWACSTIAVRGRAWLCVAACAGPCVAARAVRGGACGAWWRVRCVVARAFFGGIAAMR